MAANSLKYKFSNKYFFRFLPAALLMLTIFLFSARPSSDMIFSWFNHIIYKGGHVIGYALLALSYWHAFGFKNDRRWLAWSLAILYAVTDEYHQSFVPGRHPSAFDVLVYDNMGALLSLWLAGHLIKQKQPAPGSVVAEKESITASG